ncbi:MAG: M48 family metalloprotease [Bryobacterales bacterium]|nr:M48 family metalloprotease [Bryobacterales bacterium]
MIGTGIGQLVTVRGDAVGSATITVRDNGGHQSSTTVSIVQEKTIPIRATILCDDNHQNCVFPVVCDPANHENCVVDDHVPKEVEYANVIWQQAGIKFVLDTGDGRSVNHMDSTAYLDANSALARKNLSDARKGERGIEVYYVRRCSDDAEALGIYNPSGIVICTGHRHTQNPSEVPRILAHELGHVMGLHHHGDPNLHLMHDELSYLEGDIRFWEVLSLAIFETN